MLSTKSIFDAYHAYAVYPFYCCWRYPFYVNPVIHEEIFDAQVTDPDSVILVYQPYLQDYYPPCFWRRQNKGGNNPVGPKFGDPD